MGDGCFFIYPKKFGFINLSITHENHNNNIVIATFFNNSFHSFGLSHARIIHAIITSMKHTTIISDIIILVNAHTIYGNAFVGFALSLFVSIQFHIIGKFVLSFIPQHQLGHFFGVSHDGVSSSHESYDGTPLQQFGKSDHSHGAADIRFPIDKTINNSIQINNFNVFFIMFYL